MVRLRVFDFVVRLVRSDSVVQSLQVQAELGVFDFDFVVKWVQE